jgi:hypothetical protein
MSKGGNTIEKLLQDRAQYVSWLTRLNSSGEAGGAAVPEAVRGRVRADYERRLESVLEELRGHTAALEEQVEVLSARARELGVRQSEHKEQLAEAEVRHVVGEYDEGKWEGIRAELLKLITHVGEELHHTAAEVDRLNEVLGTIRTPIAPPEPAAPPPAQPPVSVSVPRQAAGTPPMPDLLNPAATLVPETFRPAGPPLLTPTPVTGAQEIPFRQQLPKTLPPKPPPPPAPKKEEQPGRTLWFPSGKPDPGGKLDELAFLKSVTGNEAQPAPGPIPPGPTPVPRRASGGFGRPPEAPAPAAPQSPPPPLPEPPIAKAPPAATEPGKDRPSAGQKTLKCGECGTLNRPTEWYCERCGAELAAL